MADHWTMTQIETILSALKDVHAKLDLALQTAAISEIAIARLDLRPGDVLAVKLSHRDMTEDFMDELDADFKKLLPETKTLFYSDMEFSVIRKEEAQ